MKRSMLLLVLLLAAYSRVPANHIPLTPPDGQGQQQQTLRNGPSSASRDLIGEGQFTGDLAFGFPLAELGGVQVLLSYSSNVHQLIRGDNRFQQAGWVGLGWRLSLGSIVADINNTRDTTDDRYYYIGTGGTNELILDTDGVFKLKDYRYWKISRSVDGSGNITGWTIITEDGTKYRYGNYNGSAFVLGYGARNATRFYLGWNGLVSSPPSDNYASVHYVPCQWDLADIEDIYGQHISISYQVEKDSLLAGDSTTSKYYTRASYPLKIQDRTGASIEFILGNLTSAEYENPFSTATTRTNQMLYQTKYLDSLVVRSAAGVATAVYDFSYTTMDASGLTRTKRYLSSLTPVGLNGSSLPATKYEYYSSGAVNPGALRKITHPEGGTTEYVYKHQTITNATLDSVWSGFSASWYPTFNSTFSPGSGSDFFAVPFTNGTSTYIEVFRWGTKGWYHDTEFPYQGTVLEFKVGSDFITIKENASTLRIYSRSGDGWETTDVSVTVGASLGVLTLGSDFFVVNHNTNYFTTVWRNNGQWGQTNATRIDNPGVSGSGPGMFVVRGGSPGQWKLFIGRLVNSSWAIDSSVTTVSQTASIWVGYDYFVEEYGNSVKAWKWNGTTWMSTLGFSTGLNPEAYTGQNFFVVKDGTSLYSFQWVAGSTQWARLKVDTLDDVTWSFANARVSIGPDYYVIGWISGGNTGELAVVRAKDGTWTEFTPVDSYSGLNSSSVVSPIVSSDGFFVEVHRAYVSEEDTGYVRHLSYDSKSWTKTTLDTYGLHGTQGQLTFPTRNTLFALIDPQNNGQELLIAYKRGYNPSIGVRYTANPSDYPLDYIVTSDGMGSSRTTTMLCENGTYDESITTAKYNKVTNILPGTNGRVISYYYCDLESTEHANFVEVPDYKELDGMMYLSQKMSAGGSTVEEITVLWDIYTIGQTNGIYHRRPVFKKTTVDGVTDSSRTIFNESNGLPSFTIQFANVVSDVSNATDVLLEYAYAFENYSSMATAGMISQPYETRTLAVSDIDEESTNISAGPTSDGDEKSASIIVSHAQPVSYTYSITWVGDVRIGTMPGGNDVLHFTTAGGASSSFTAEAGHIYYVTVSVPEGTGHTCAASMTTTHDTWQDTTLVRWSRTEYSENLPQRSRMYDGSAWTTGDSIVSRDSYGNITQRDNVNKLRTSYLYGYDSTRIIAQAINTNASELFVDGFGYTQLGCWWTKTDNGGDGDTKWSIEDGKLRQSDSVSAYSGELDRITCDIGSEIAGDVVFEFDLKIADCDSWDFTFGAGGDVWSGSHAHGSANEEAVWTAINNETWYYLSNSSWTVIRSGLTIGQTYHFKIVAHSVAGKADYYVDGVRYVTNGNFQTSTTGFDKIVFANYGYETTKNTTWYVDNLRMYPADALVTSTSYDPVTRLSVSSTDVTGTTSYIDYDDFGRPVESFRDDGLIVSQSIHALSREQAGDTFTKARPNMVETKTYPQGLRTSGLAGYWRFEGNGNDDTDNSNDGTAFGNAHYDGRGQFGNGLTLDGSGDYVRVPYNASLNPSTGITLGAWVKFDVASGYRWVIEKKGNYWKQYYLWWLPSGYIVAGYHDGSSYRDYTYAWTPTTGRWYHLAWTADGSNVKIYVDGVLKVSYGQTNSWQSSTSGELEIGRNVGGSYYFDGTIDEAMVYGMALSSSDIESMYKASVSTHYSDGLGRTVQTQVHDETKNLVSAVEYDQLGRAYRTYVSYAYDTNNSYDSLYASHAGSVSGSGRPYSESFYYSDPLSRDSLTKVVDQQLADEELRKFFGSASVDGKTLRYAETRSKASSQSNWVASRTYYDVLGRAVVDTTWAIGGSIVRSSRTNFNMLGQPYRQIAPKGDTSLVEYNFLGQKTLTRSVDAGTSHYVYDKAGRLRFMVDSTGRADYDPDHVLYWKYDPLGRVSEKGYTADHNWDESYYQGKADSDPTFPSTPAAWRAVYAYDTSSTGTYTTGRVVSVQTNGDTLTDMEVEETFSYDKWGNLKAKTVKVPDYTSTSYTTTYTYDLVGRVVQEIYPASDYTTITVTRSYDQLGRSTKIGLSGGNALAAYSYNSLGQMATETLNPDVSGGQVRSFAYNKQGLLTSISNSLFTQTLRTDSGQTATEAWYHGLYGMNRTNYGFSGAPAQQKYRYDYDDHGRLITANNGANNAWDLGVSNPTTFDLNGNIQSMQKGTEANITYTYYSGTNKLQNTDGSGNDYQYEPTGNLDSSKGLPIQYDSFTMLPTYIDLPGAESDIAYQYDATRERVFKLHHDSPDEILTMYVRGTESYPLMVKNSVESEQVYVYGPTGLIAYREASTWYFVHKDHLGSVRLTSTASNTRDDYYDYGPYGNVLRASSTSYASRYLFTGQEYDIETNLYNFRARLYDTTTALFYAVDPVRQTFSSYGYALNNPIRFVDPSGNISEADRYSSILAAQYQAELNSWHQLLYGGDGGPVVIGLDGSYITGAEAAAYKILARNEALRNGHPDYGKFDFFRVRDGKLYGLRYRKCETSSAYWGESVAAEGFIIPGFLLQYEAIWTFISDISTSASITFDGSQLNFEYTNDEGTVSATFTGISGPWEGGPAPRGTYIAWNFRTPRKGQIGMDYNGVSFSLDLAPLFYTSRQLLRIHPDGGGFGTEGCIGICGPDSYGAYLTFKDYFDNRGLPFILRIQ